MASYQTMQRNVLVEFMKNNCEKAFSAEELSQNIKEAFGDSAPGKSTIYRLLQKLTEEGLVKRMVKGNSRKFVYQISAGEHCDSHLHLKCINCGKLLHMDDSESHKLLMQVFKKNSFSIDERQTVLLGKCGGCTGKVE